MSLVTPADSPPTRAFLRPDFEAEIDAAAEVARIPRDATTKGLYFRALHRVARQGGIPLPSASHQVGLLDYPNREYTELVLEVARRLHTALPLREALRRVGQTAFPTLRASLFGRAIFGTVGANIPARLRLVARGWETSTSHSRARLLEVGDDHAVVEVTGCHSLLDSYVVGIFEGVILDRGAEPTVRLKPTSPTDGLFHCAWRSPPP